jgi:hypothetical protein
MIHLITGRQGSGKTLFLVKIGYDAYKRGLTVYSNVKLNFPFKQLDYNDIIECNLENGVVLLDEGHQLLSARASMSRVNREICDSFLSMVRKKGLELYATTQTARKIDVRFREETDYLYVCSRFAFINGTWKEVFHNQNLPSRIPVMIKLETQEQYSGNWINVSFLANKYYRMFDTRQIIKIKGLTV